MNDIPADAAPTAEGARAASPPGEPSSACRGDQRGRRPGRGPPLSGSPTEAPPPPTPNPQSTAGWDVTTNLVDCPPGAGGRGHRKGGETIKGLRRIRRRTSPSTKTSPRACPEKISISARRVHLDTATKLVEDLPAGGLVSGSDGPGQAHLRGSAPRRWSWSPGAVQGTGPKLLNLSNVCN